MSHHTAHDRRTSETLAAGLGWFSIGLGAAELAFPHEVARLAGLPDSRATASLLRGYGVREIGNGLALLAQPDEPAWLWSRVSGDLIDMATLGAAAGARRADPDRLAVAACAVAGVAIVDVLAALQASEARSREWRETPRGVLPPHGVRVVQVTTVNRPIEEAYRFWHNLENLPRFMRHLSSVESLGEGRTRWRARGPAGVPVVWEARTTDDREPERIAWESLEGAMLDNRGSVEFRHAPGARGTEVRVEIEYLPPAGALGRGVAWLFGKDPEQTVREDLHRFKQLLEAGEIAVSDAPGIRGAAQPPADPARLRAFASGGGQS